MEQVLYNSFRVLSRCCTHYHQSQKKNFSLLTTSLWAFIPMGTIISQQL